MSFFDEPDQTEREILRYVPIGSTTMRCQKRDGAEWFQM